jgi:hypothetical protein
MTWIRNGLFGPGHLNEVQEQVEKNTPAQEYFDKHEIPIKSHAMYKADVEKWLSEKRGNDTAMDCRASEFKWNNPEDVPVIQEGTEKGFWLAVEIDSPKFEKPKKITFLAQYQNRPYKEGDEDLHGDDALVNTDGEYVNSVGWVTCQSHCEFDNYYELITFNENYKLLGWAEYTSPKFP